mgnify:CR=1 FL=1
MATFVSFACVDPSTRPGDTVDVSYDLVIKGCASTCEDTLAELDWFGEGQCDWIHVDGGDAHIECGFGGHDSCERARREVEEMLGDAVVELTCEAREHQVTS